MICCFLLFPGFFNLLVMMKKERRTQGKKQTTSTERQTGLMAILKAERSFMSEGLPAFKNPAYTRTFWCNSGIPYAVLKWMHFAAFQIAAGILPTHLQ